MEKKLFNKVIIVGTGLIGGSIGCAIKAKGLAFEVIGAVRDRETERLAKEKKAVDRCVIGLDPLRVEFKSADLIILCTPVSTIKDFLHAENKALLASSAIITDVGSTKVEITRTGKHFLADRFVGCHPFTGSEKSGIKNADPNMFKDSYCFVTETKGEYESNSNVSKVVSLWRAIGAHIQFIDPKEHDELVTKLSHLPHLLAFSHLLIFGEQEARDIGIKYHRYLNPSMKALARLAKSDSAMWSAIFWANRQEVLNQLSKFQLNIDKFKAILNQKIVKDFDEGKSPLEQLSRLIINSHGPAKNLLPDQPPGADD